jgi:nucleoside-diphosphate-sugar epimerase
VLGWQPEIELEEGLRRTLELQDSTRAGKAVREPAS